jgi:hypothetical protein
MDATSAAVAERAIAAAFNGQSWVDERFSGTEEYRFYTLSVSLFALDVRAWWTFLKAIEAGGPQTLGRHQYETLRTLGQSILDQI